jgi:homopolymeric O-antigen transport system ATP-binding protein
MPEAIIRVQNLAKRYAITVGQHRHDTLRDQVSDAFRLLLGRNGYHRGQKEIFWALKNVSFEVKPGEVIGVIGRNGAGKSTLLKILSRVTAPTGGSVEIRGRVGSLLEVGTGFHSELTGRENIYLNGAILGMKKAEIERKFDDIVSFAEVEKFIDTPVKHYSSGMYVRLAFAVAAHLEPEVLIVDEVLAVGDTAFQKKCLGKIQGVAHDGRTVLFVSHNMAAVENLCQRVIVLQQGEVAFAGAMKEGIDRYFQSVSGEAQGGISATVDLAKHSGRPAIYQPLLTGLEFSNGNGRPLNGGVKVGAALKVAIHLRAEHSICNVDACLGFDTLSGQRVFTAHTAFEPNRSMTETGLNTQGGDRDATLPERTQCSSAMKPQTQRFDNETSDAKVKHRIEGEHGNETFYPGAFAPPGSRPDRQSIRRLPGSVNNPGECVGERTFICEIPSLVLVPGIYKILVALGIGGETADLVEDAARIEVVDADYYGTGKSPWNGLIVLKHHWYMQ